MLRIIDMTDAASSNDFQFAVWNTVNGLFLKSSTILIDTQVWNIEDWKEDFADHDELRERVLKLLPKEFEKGEEK